MNLYRYNSTFRIKVKEAKSIKPPSLLSRGRLRRAGTLKANGRRTNDWRKVWRFLKAELEKRGRTRCEFGFIPHECFGRLDPCHSRKRRLMQGNDIYAVAMGCQNAHRILDEVLSHKLMERAVLQAIESHGGIILPKEKQP